MIAGSPIAAIILAGGQATRLGGGDKALLQIGGATILDRIIAALASQCDPLVLSANGDLSRFGSRLPVVPDSLAGQLGPLAGILSGLDWLADTTPATRYALTVPGDTPFLPADLVARLRDQRAAEDTTLAYASSAGQAHFTITLWPVGLRGELRHAVADAGLRKVGGFLDTQATSSVEWAAEPFDPFFNVNTLDDKAAAEDIASGIQSGSLSGPQQT